MSKKPILKKVITLKTCWDKDELTLIFKPKHNETLITSERVLDLEVVGERENGRARGRHARGEAAPARKFPENRVCPRVSPRAPVFSRAHYFQEPATQASG